MINENDNQPVNLAAVEKYQQELRFLSNKEDLMDPVPANKAHDEIIERLD